MLFSSFWISNIVSAKEKERKRVPKKKGARERLVGACTRERKNERDSERKKARERQREREMVKKPRRTREKVEGKREREKKGNKMSK